MQPIEIPDFNELMRMAREEPEALALLQQQCTDRLLASAPPESRHRLKGMVFVLDAKRRTTHSPVEACAAMSELMLDRLKVLQANFEDIKGIAETALDEPQHLPSRHLVRPASAEPAKVVPFIRP